MGYRSGAWSPGLCSLVWTVIECALIPRSASGAGGGGNPRPLRGPSRQGDGNPMHAQPAPSLHSHLTLLPGGAPLDAGGVAFLSVLHKWLDSWHRGPGKPRSPSPYLGLGP